MTQIHVVVFMFFGDLDLDLWPIFTKKVVKLAGYAESTVKYNLDRCKTVACRRCDRHTDKRTDQYTLRKVVDFRKVTTGHTNYTQGWRGGRRSPAVACWASDHWVASSNPLRGMFRH